MEPICFISCLFGGITSLCHILWGGREVWVLKKAPVTSQGGYKVVHDKARCTRVTEAKELAHWLLVRREH